MPDVDPAALLMPADGRISQLGPIENGHIFQAKGQSFTAAELLGDAASAAPFNNGLFATVYLSPKDYHRVHMPWTGTLRETVHVPGRLFSVGPDAVRNVPRLFARNERLVCHFDTDFGPMASVMVGRCWSPAWKRSGAAWRSRAMATASRARTTAAKGSCWRSLRRWPGLTTARP